MFRGILGLAAALLAGCGGEPAPLRVYAAASLAELIDEAGEVYRQRSGVTVEAAYGASSTLARQIRAGAPADLFVSADREAIAVVAPLLARPPGRVLFGNRLVVVVPPGSAPFRNAADLRRLPSLALADPELAPAGRYARRWLEREGIWTALAPRLLPCASVRAAVAAVRGGHAAAAVVYATDAANSGLPVAFAPAAGQAPAVSYWGAALAQGHPRRDEMLAFLAGAEVARLAANRGFLPPQPKPGASEVAAEGGGRGPGEAAP